jgi:restriction endonuclease S subunit
MNNKAKLIKLREIASIRIGYPFRGSLERDPEGTVGVVQMKDINKYNKLDLSELYKVQIEDLNEQHWLRRGDILFRSKGVSNTAALVEQDLKQVVASSHLTVIRINSRSVDPGYVVWYINHPYGQSQIKRFSQGTSLQMVTNSELGEVKIDLPSLKEQKLIAEVAALSCREQQIMEELTQKRKIYIDAVLMRQARAKVEKG